MMSTGTDWAWPWWTVMFVINAVNLGLATLVYRRSMHPEDGLDSRYRKQMRFMGFVFVLVGAYRSIFVSRYFSQMAWFDTILNSSLIIRTFAVAAELSFVGLFALALLRVNSDFSSDESASNGLKTFFMKQSPYFLIASIFFAQFFAYGGLIMKSKTLFAIEESLWSLGFVSILPLAFVQWKRVKAASDDSLAMLKSSTRLILGWCVIYCVYGLFYHLPLENWPSAFQQMETGFPAIRTGWAAIVDAFLIVNESKAYGDWGFGFLLWHSAYFSICAWIAIFLMQAPRRLRLGN